MKTRLILKNGLSLNIPEYSWPVLTNLIWLGIYALVVKWFGIPTAERVFSSMDSQSYLAVGNYFFGGDPTNATLYRPFLYPVLLKFMLLFGGVPALWVFQAVLWLISLNLLFYTCKKLFKHSFWPTAISVIFSLNITFIVLTMHALTEVLVAFGLSVYIFFVARNCNQGLSKRFVLGSLMIFSFLTVVKPVYYLVVIVFLVVIIFKWKIWQGAFLPRVLVALAPIFFQVAIVFFVHGQLAISKIGSATFKTNFVASGYGLMHNLKLHEAQKEIRNLSNAGIYRLLSENKSHFTLSYFRNLEAHWNGHPSYVNKPQNKAALSIFMARYNRILFWSHLFFLPLLIFRVLSSRNSENLLLILLGLPWLLIALTSGISVNQGDRLVLPGLLLCFALYPLLIRSFLQMLKIRKTIFKANTS